jgi:hypothetical protein
MLLQEWAADLKRDKVRYDTAVAQRVCTADIVTAMARKRRVMGDIVGVMNLWSALRPRPTQAVGSTDALRNSSSAEELQDDADVAEVFMLEQMKGSDFGQRATSWWEYRDRAAAARGGQAD